MDIPTFAFTTFPSPVGQLKLVASPRGLTAVLWENETPGRVTLGYLQESPDHPILTQTTAQLTEYFAGTRQTFTLPLDARGTSFQQQVWNALLAIPYGQTRTYSEIAASLGSPDAVRAVGAANGRNPLGIVAPCHRVIGASGQLTGFAGGLAAKTWLLEHEGALQAPTLF